MTGTLTDRIASTAARLVVDEGMEYGPAKRKAARSVQAGSGRRVPLPDNDKLENEVRAYIDLFHADTQPRELAALRALAMQWMQRLQAFRPHLTGAVWRGTATRLSSVHLQLFCDDPKSAEIELIDRGVRYEVGSLGTGSGGGPVDVLSLTVACAELAQPVTLHLSILDRDDLRGALRPDAVGRSERGDVHALRRMLDKETS